MVFLLSYGRKDLVNCRKKEEYKERQAIEVILSVADYLKIFYEDTYLDDLPGFNDVLYIYLPPLHTTT